MWNAVARSKVYCGLLACLIVVLALAACRTRPPAIKIGLVAPFEGRERTIGYDAIYAARLAVREINEQGGISGRPVELVALDDSGAPDLARQAAASLVVDPAVVAVTGHWLPQTTAAARDIYEENGLPLVILGKTPLDVADAGRLPPEFRRRYEDVTPFDEVAGPYAGSTYDAVRLLFVALEVAESRGEISRESVAQSLHGLQYAGVTGTVFQP